MKPFFLIRDKHLKAISRIMVFIALAWLIVPENQTSYQYHAVKFLKPVHPSVIQVEVLKNNNQNISFRDFSFEVIPSAAIFGFDYSLKRIKQFVHVTSLERNPFYVHTTINAP